MSFRRALCITVDTDGGRERWKTFVRECNALNVGAPAAAAPPTPNASSDSNILFSAMDVEKIPGVLVGESRGQKMTGCMLAHRNCANLIETGVREGRDVAATVLEDDVRFPSFEDAECWVKNILPEAVRLRADLVLGGVHGVRPVALGESYPIPGCTCRRKHVLMQCSHFTGFHCYSPLSPAARKLFREAPSNYNVDVFVGNKSGGPLPQIRAYCVYPFVADTRPCISNIKGDHRDYTSYFQRCAKQLETALSHKAMPTNKRAPPLRLPPATAVDPQSESATTISIANGVTVKVGAYRRPPPAVRAAPAPVPPVLTRTPPVKKAIAAAPTPAVVAVGKTAPPAPVMSKAPPPHTPATLATNKRAPSLQRWPQARAAATVAVGSKMKAAANQIMPKPAIRVSATTTPSTVALPASSSSSLPTPPPPNPSKPAAEAPLAKTGPVPLPAKPKSPVVAHGPGVVTARIAAPTRFRPGNGMQTGVGVGARLARRPMPVPAVTTALSRSQ